MERLLKHKLLVAAVAVLVAASAGAAYAATQSGTTHGAHRGWLPTMRVCGKVGSFARRLKTCRTLTLRKRATSCGSQAWSAGDTVVLSFCMARLVPGV